MNLWLEKGWRKNAQPKNLSLESEEYKDKYTSRWFQQIPCSNIKLTNSSWSANHVQATALDVINVGIHRYIHKSATFRFRNNKTKLGPPIHKPIKFYHAFLFFCIFFLFMFFKIFLEPICDTCRWTVCTGGTIFDVRQTVRHFIGGISVRSHRWAVGDRWTARSF